MKLLIIAGAYPPANCGVGDYTALLAQSLATLPGYEVHVLTSLPDNGEAETVSGSDMLLIHRKMPDWGISGFRQLLNTLREIRPDITHIQYPTQGFAGHLFPWFLPLICRLAGSKVVQTWHERFALWRAPMWALLAFVPGVTVVVRPNYLEALHPGLSWIRHFRKVIYIRSGSSIPVAKLGDADVELLRSRYTTEKKLLVFFGFLYRNKGVGHIFEFADPRHCHLVIAGAIPEDGEYLRELQNRAAQQDWKGRVTFAGPLPATDIAELLAVADVVVLPYDLGGGEWNSSLLAAIANHTFVLTTSNSKSGYEAATDTYYAQPGNIEEMRQALQRQLAGEFKPQLPKLPVDDWQRIACEHDGIYQTLVSR